MEIDESPADELFTEYDNKKSKIDIERILSNILSFVFGFIVGWLIFSIV